MRNVDISWEFSELRLPDRGDGGGAFDGARLPKKPLLSLEQIKDWVDVYRTVNDGRFPSVRGGNVLNADGSETGETWNGIHGLFSNAAKGFPARGLKDCGFTSLPDFLDKTYPEERNPRAKRIEKADLTLEQIKEWVDVYRSANAGAFPTSHESCNALHAYGSETGESWNSIDQLFRAAAKGFPARGLKGCGFTSLREFLDTTYPEERPKRVEKSDLTLEQIEDWVDVYRTVNQGRFPSNASGNVLNADGSDTGETWCSIGALFITAVKGFPARGLKDCGFTSLPDFLDKTYPEERNPRAKRIEKADLTLEQIKEWVDVYRSANAGAFPSMKSGNVLNDDGSETGETWGGITALFHWGAKGGPARGLKDCGFKSLPDFLDTTYPEERAHRLEKGALTLQQIEEWVEVYRSANAGAFPSEGSGNVLNADGSETGDRWRGINRLFTTAAKGAPARGLKDCGFTTLADFLDKTYPEERNPRAKRERIEKADLTLELIKEWVKVYRSANAGAFPSERSGNVLNADGSETGDKWNGISMLFTTAAKGFPARGLKGCGFRSLSDFLDKTYPEERRGERKIKYPDQDILLRMFE